MPERILIVRLGAMGDVIHALPAVAGLHAKHPKAETVWVVDPKWAVLLRGNPAVHRIIEFDRRSLASIRSTCERLREQEFPLSYDLQGLIKSAVLPWLARGCRERHGFDAGAAREKHASWFYTHRCLPVATHVVDRNLELCGGLAAASVHPYLPQGSPEGRLPDEPFVLASPLAGWRSKQWPLEYFAELARLLDPVPLVVNGAPAAAAELESIPGAWVHLSGIEGLLDATRRAAAVVGVDSGPLHMAAALAKPGVAIFGPTDPARNGPYGGTIQVLRVPGAETTYRRGYEIADSMRAILPAEVLQKLKEIRSDAFSL